jgi:hypothetical protein
MNMGLYPDRQAFRRRQLENLGAGAQEMAELLTYNDNVFQTPPHNLTFPLADEPCALVWEEYASAARADGVFSCLKQRLVQFHFPIQAGISASADYQAATKRGHRPDELHSATGLALAEPALLQLEVCATPAGRIPVLFTPVRADFVILVQALAFRNEPQALPASMGATIIGGLNNWDRIHRYRRQWEDEHPLNKGEAAWKEEFQRLSARKELYQDRLIVLSGGPYSGVAARQLALDDNVWGTMSLQLRREHEITHYLTRRVFGSMRNNLLDEILADYRAIVATLGHFRADWLLTFLGLESFPDRRPGGRLENYLGVPSLSAGAVKILCCLVQRAATNLEALSIRSTSHATLPASPLQIFLALTQLTLEEMASTEFMQQLEPSTAFVLRVPSQSGESVKPAV